MAKGKISIGKAVTKLGLLGAGVGVGKGIDMIPMVSSIDPLYLNGGKVLVGGMASIFVKNEMIQSAGEGLYSQGLNMLIDKGLSMVAGIGNTNTYAFLSGNEAPRNTGKNFI